MSKKLSSWFWIIVLIHVVVWTFLPTLIRHTLPMDANEGYMWGTYLDWGYDRDPWLNAWLTRFAVDIGGHSGWLVYALSQMCVVAAFWSVWQLGLRMISPVHAVMSVLMLEGIQYYHLAVIDFNDNALELGLWPLMALMLYRALVDQKNRYWLAFGLVSGLGLMAKYYTAFPLACMALFVLIEPQARACLKRIGPYISVALIILIILPHVLWLFDHDFITVQYTQHRVNPKHQNWLMHFYPGIRFFGNQIAAFLGAVIVCLPLLLSPVPVGCYLPTEKVSELNSFNRKFLWWMGIGPFVLTVLVSLVTGWKLNTMWGTPLLSLWGLVLFLYWKPMITPRRWSIFLGTVLFVLFGLAVGYTVSLTQPGSESSANEPAQDLVKIVEKIWFQHTSKPLYYVGGDRYLSSYLVYYSYQHPHAFVEFSLPNSHWIDMKHLREKGAIFLRRLDPDEIGVFPQKVMLEYPQLKVLPAQHLEYHRAVLGQPALHVLIGVLLPAAQQKE